MAKFITIRIVKPDISGLTKQQEYEFINQIAADIASQISRQVLLAKQSDEIAYWQRRLLEWNIETLTHELKYGNRIQRRSNQDALDDMGYERKSDDQH